jgi:hypothetical protein
MGVSNKLHTPTTLTPAKKLSVHTHQEAGWSTEPVRKRLCKEKNFKLCQETNLSCYKIVRDK